MSPAFCDEPSGILWRRPCSRLPLLLYPDLARGPTAPARPAPSKIPPGRPCTHGSQAAPHPMSGQPRPGGAAGTRKQRKPQKMAPLQNDPQQHQREAKNRKCRISRGGKRSPDSESARRELSKSGLASHVGPQKCDFASNSGGGTTTGTPKCTRVRPRRNQCTTEAL